MTSLPDSQLPEGMNRRRAAKLTAWLAIAHSLLTIAAYFFFIQAPRPRASDTEFLEFVESGARNLVVIAGLYLMPFAAISFLWFIVLLRAWIRRVADRIDDVLSSVQLVSGILYLALFLLAAAAITVLAVSNASEPDVAATNRQFSELGWALFVIFSMRMAAIFVFTTSTLGRRHRFLPRWFTFLGYAVGAFLLLSANITPALILVFPGWILVLGVILLLEARAMPTTRELPTMSADGA
jgi:hypothetical protein